MRKKITAVAAGVAALSAVALGVGASPAAASPGGCVWGTDACLFYHSNESGGFNGDGGNDNYGAAWYFEGCSGGNCDGDGQQVYNNIGYVYNESYRTVTIFALYNCNYNGPNLTIGPTTGQTLYGSGVYNHDASQCFS
ncbi:hypothetical protein [Kitasatospora sp. GAS204B]|uniref:hypothetical protein n=1 Tax=unclassified Kitasatospora TaxID=2633591 RepID=UPI0024736DAD|nr:hypothetical protein [Kitasatospora sp. GAS204B]MDH6118552.1 hypothetical protein [Kitasatospora sp. GAS204B]